MTLRAVAPFLLVLALHAAPSMAIPVVSVDANPSAAGVQSEITLLDAGTVFAVDIVIQDVVSPDEVKGFEFDLFFDGAILDALSVESGDFLLDPIFTVQESVGAVSVEFAEVSLLPGGATGSGSLARITFETLAIGESALDLGNVIVAQPFGVPLDIGDLADGRVVVAIPEPRAALLFAVGSLVAVARWPRAPR